MQSDLETTLRRIDLSRIASERRPDGKRFFCHWIVKFSLTPLAKLRQFV